jgi:hypothetical protein
LGNTQFEYDGGPGADKVVVQGGSDFDFCEVNGDVPSRDVPDPHYSLSNQRTGQTTEIFTSNLEIDTVDLGGGDDELHVHWDPEMFAGVGRFTVNGGAGNDDISFLFDQPFASLDRAQPPLQIVVNGNDGDDSVGALFDNPLLHVIFNPQPDPPGRINWTVNGGRGNDDVSMNHSAPEWFSVSAAIDVGDGADSVLLDWLGPTESETSIPPSEWAPFNGNVAVKLGSGVNQFQFHGAGGFETFGLDVTGGIHADEALISFDETTVTESLTTSVNLANGANSAQWNVNGLSVNSQFVASYRGGKTGDEVGMSLINAEIGDDGLVALSVAPGNGTNVTSIQTDAITVQPGGRLTGNISGGTGIDDVSIFGHGNHVGGTETWTINTGNGTNSVGFQTENGVLDGKSVVTIRGGTGADEVALLPSVQHVGPEGVWAVNTYLGNGTNTALLQLEEFTVEGRATFTTQGGTGADEVGIVPVQGHVALGASLAFNTNLGNGTNRYNQRSEGMVVEGTFETIVRGGTGRDDVAASFLGGEVAAGATLRIQMLGSEGVNTLRADIVDLVLDGELRLVQTAGRSADLLSARASLDPRSTGAVLAQLRGGAGNDTLGFDLIGDELVEVLAASILDGGLGTDTCLAHARVRVVNCER